MEPRSSTEYIVVHCSATKPSMDVGLKQIKIGTLMKEDGEMLVTITS